MARYLNFGLDGQQRSGERRVRLITFAGGPLEWQFTAKRFEREARKSGLFDDLVVFGPDDVLSNPRLEGLVTNGWFSDHKRGFGLWAWKPAIILGSLEELNDEDILVYSDVGCSFSPISSSKTIWTEWIGNATMHGQTFFQPLGGSELTYTKPELLEAFATSPADRQSGQVIATISIWKRDKSSISIAEQWLSWSLFENCRYLLDDLNPKETPGFLSHRHDQSVLSLIVKSRSSGILRDSTYLGPGWDSGKRESIPILSTRQKTIFSKSALDAFPALRIIWLLEKAFYKLERSIRNLI